MPARPVPSPSALSAVDTLTQIANRFRVTVESLMIANGLRSSALRVGQQIVAYVR